MPNRILKESVCTSDEVNRLSFFEEVFFYRLIVNCDDFGRMDARPKVLAAKLFPLKDIRANQIEEALRSLISAELVSMYTVDGKPFMQIKTWNRHQQIRAHKSKYPGPETDECKQMIADDCRCSRNPIQSESESESNPHPPRRRARRKADEDVVPVENVEAVENFCKQNGINADARGFYQHYSALGWRDSKGKPIRNWRALLMKWADDHPATEHRTGITADDPTGTRGRSFDTGEFMQAALSRSYGKEA